jgi:hypothetical protein
MNALPGFKPFHDPSRKPQWAQLSRLGGDRVAILFKELRQSLGRIDGIVERLSFAGDEDGWVVQYCAGNTELFTARISPGLLEVKIPSESGGVESKMLQLSAALKRAIQNSQSARFWQFCLKNRAMVHSFASLVAARSKQISKVVG